MCVPLCIVIEESYSVTCVEPVNKIQPEDKLSTKHYRLRIGNYIEDGFDCYLSGKPTLRYEAHYAARDSCRKPTLRYEAHYAARDSIPPPYYLQLPEGRELHHVIRNSPVPTLDLHGMRERQALDWTEYFLRNYRHHVVHIITGRGLHSTSGVPVLREAVRKYCVQKGYSCSFVGNNTGCLAIRRSQN
ncbi:uncharacterized protein LOC122247581 [Penaeus japonicus]|uniref:uncharacterized protein LOC122247581 n=1 Tax=Penaeus japonicus TaxID=27405 RepID=UPI001C7179ED|nr:uncharacterized protein LOC122247581 [Penaeus japonicus]